MAWGANRKREGSKEWQVRRTSRMGDQKTRMGAKLDREISTKL